MADSHPERSGASDDAGHLRILVTGSRDWTDYKTVSLALLTHIADPTSVTIVHGDCPSGADHLAATYARAWGVNAEPHPADCSQGRSAGPRRNAEMVALGADVCLAFIRNGSRGATGCADMAEKAGIPTRRFQVSDR